MGHPLGYTGYLIRDSNVDIDDGIDLVSFLYQTVLRESLEQGWLEFITVYDKS